ncbi:MAG: hypothetical protein Q7V13_10045 [Phenylobacterium sp.]|uniref:hypothetical protein n=1 Tax=Phenylobacterium sp. TaxID=1871053 RepID=UPI00271812C1|nr:hypothetical protein [Phenylobacterium sp.]MDO8912182.1 hypothetical protein [Phenylobacterium sp.]
MKPVDIFFQGDHSREIDLTEAHLAETLAELKARLVRDHGVAAEAFIFIEDEDEPLGEDLIIELVVARGPKLHFSRCREVEVTVAYAGHKHHRAFAPSATVGRVKDWAAKAFGMTAEDAGEHLLQIAGTHDRPAPNTHIGSITNEKCKIAFDLVADERVNGASTPTEDEGR